MTNHKPNDVPFLQLIFIVQCQSSEMSFVPLGVASAVCELHSARIPPLPLLWWILLVVWLHILHDTAPTASRGYLQAGDCAMRWPVRAVPMCIGGWMTRGL
jgi:hypothetical protein